jgi:hypothetical protein
MTLDDRDRFGSALQRLGRLGEVLPLNDDAMRDWWSQLARYPIDVVEWALQEAPRARVSTGARFVQAGLIQELCRKRQAEMTQAPQTRYVPKGEAVIHAPGTRLHGKRMQVVDAEYRCALCEDRGVLPATPSPRDGIEPETLVAYSFVRHCPQCRPEQAQRAQARAGAA